MNKKIKHFLEESEKKFNSEKEMAEFLILLSNETESKYKSLKSKLDQIKNNHENK